MQILISIDDTDNLESRGTGALASELAREVEEKGWGVTRFITRHQLLVHPDIPYTSHNSSMCFAAEIDETRLESIIQHAAAFLSRESAPGSDPGLCVAAVDRLTAPRELIAFGQRAKQAVLTKGEAYAAARELGVHLSEHGGTGQGVIGALAGAGLRLSGNDGRLKGELRFASPGGVISVAALCDRDDVDEVRILEGGSVDSGDLVRLGEKVKTVLVGGKSVLLVIPAREAVDEACWETCPRHLLKKH